MTPKIPNTRTIRAYPGRPRRRPLLGLGITLLTLAALLALVLMTAPIEPTATAITLATALDDSFNPVTPTETFHPKETFFVSVKITNYRSDENIKARWIFDGVKLRETTLQTNGFIGTITAGFSLSSSSPWPVGRYSVEIVYGDKILGSAAFHVEQ
jgi:hypothetical protein